MTRARRTAAPRRITPPTSACQAASGPLRSYGLRSRHAANASELPPQSSRISRWTADRATERNSRSKSGGSVIADLLEELHAVFCSQFGPHTLPWRSQQPAPVPVSESVDQWQAAPALVVRSRLSLHGNSRCLIHHFDDEPETVAEQADPDDQHAPAYVQRTAVDSGCLDGIGDHFADHQLGRLGEVTKIPRGEREPDVSAGAAGSGRERSGARRGAPSRSTAARRSWTGPLPRRAQS